MMYQVEELLKAVNAACSCGGHTADNPAACSACQVWHLIHGRKIAGLTELDGTFPVSLFFLTDADREDFIRIVRQAKPGLVARKLS